MTNKDILQHHTPEVIRYMVAYLLQKHAEEKRRINALPYDLLEQEYKTEIMR